MDDVEIMHGDSESVAFGMGTYGSRSIAVGGTAIVKSIEKIVEKGKKIAAHKLEANADDIEFASGKFTVKGTDKSVSFGDVALTAYVPHVILKIWNRVSTSAVFMIPLISLIHSVAILQ